eukprot:340818_1
MIQKILPCFCKLLPYINDWEIIENILWSFKQFVYDEKCAKYILDECVQEIILILKELLISEKKNEEVMRGGFIVIRIIANHCDVFATKILSMGFLDIDLHLYLSHSDGRIVTNVLQTFKVLITKQSGNNELKINYNILSVLLDILDIEYVLEFAENEKQINDLISVEEQFR